MNPLSSDRGASIESTAVHVVAGLVELREGVELPEAFRNLLELMSRLDFGERHFGHAGERAVECARILSAGDGLQPA